MKNKTKIIIYLFLAFALFNLSLVSVNALITPSIEMKDIFNTGENIALTYSIVSDINEQITYSVAIDCPEIPLPLLEIKTANLISNTPLKGIYNFGIVEESFEPETCIANLIINGEKISLKEFHINTQPSIDFDLKICKNKNCEDRSKVFLKDNEQVYIDYFSSISSLVTKAYLTYPDNSIKEIIIPSNTKLSLPGLYELKVDYSKTGYKNGQTSIVFNVLDQKINFKSASRCNGDGICSDNENNKNCPQDCRKENKKSEVSKRSITGNVIANFFNLGYAETCDDGNIINGDGCSASCKIEMGWSCSGICTNFKDYTIPNPVTNFRINSTGQGKIYLTWTNPADKDFNSTVLATIIPGTAALSLFETDKNYYNFSGPAGSYTFSIHTKDKSNNINYYPLVLSTTIAAYNDTIPPSTIANLNISYTGPSNIIWSWINPSESDFNSTIVSIDGINKINLTKTLNSYEATGLNSNTTHIISIKTKDNLGNINNNQVNNTATTKIACGGNITTNCTDIIPPGQVTNLKASSITRSNITWSWTNPLDADFNSTIIFINGINKANLTKSLNSYSATGLSRNTAQTILVKTKDNSNNINPTSMSLTTKTAVK